MFGRAIMILTTLPRRVKLTWALLNDSRIPTWQKAIPFLPFIYILSPLNFLTIAIPVIGQLDDVMLIVLAMDLLERVVDQNILKDYKNQ